MSEAVKTLELLGGVLAVVAVVDSAVRTFVLPRGSVVVFTRIVWLAVRSVFNLAARATKTYEGRDRVMALYAPLALLVLPVVWLSVVFGGYVLLYRAFGLESWRQAFYESGSSMFTLGWVRPRDLSGATLAFTEAMTGLGLLALLIAYLPSIYGAFSRREVLVAQLAVRAGSPPTPVELLVRAHRIGKLEQLDDDWLAWQRWFAELEETHVSQGSLVFFRSPRPDRSWITAAGAVLDSAALVNSTVDVPQSPQASLCIRSGYVALRAIADFYSIPYDPDPRQADPVSIARDEWEDVYRQLDEAGVPLVSDRDQAWLDFNGWRVNYDAVLIALAGLIMAPYGLWSSDRSLRVRRPPLRQRRR